MTPNRAPDGSVDIDVDAAPDRIYALITDLATLAELAEETATMRWTRGDGARPGSVFKGTNRNGSHRWTTTCTVTEAQPGRVFAFDVDYLSLPIAHWRYDISDISDTSAGARVTESTWDRRPGWFRRVAGYATGVHDRTSANVEHIRVTLQRLKERAETR